MAGEVVDTGYGPISGDFVHSLLGDLCVPDGGVQTGPFGSQLHASDYVDYGTPIITVEHLGDNRIIHGNLPRVSDEDRDRLSKYILKTGDIVFSRVGSVDRRAIVHPEEDGWLFSGRCLRVRPDAKQIDARYLSWFFGLPGFKEYVRQIAVGATMPSLNTTILSNVPIYFPPTLQEQQAIAWILGALDDKIELNRRMNETLEEIARAIFKSWFVDFLPVRAKQRTRTQTGDPVRAKTLGTPGTSPANATLVRGAPGLAPHIADLFPDAIEDTEFGEIPRGWRIRGLTDEFSLIMGQSPPGSTYNEEGQGLPFFQGRRDFGHRYPTDRVYCTAPTRYAAPGDTLVTVRAPVGDINMAAEQCCIGRGVAALRHKSGGRSYTYYAVHFMKDTFLTFEAEGTVFGSISKRGFESTRVIAPPNELVTHFENLAFPLDERITIDEAELRFLQSIRDELLPKLISGELRVPDAERIVERYV